MGLHTKLPKTLNDVERTLRVGTRDYRFVSLAALQDAMPSARIAELPVSLKVLLENLLRNVARGSVSVEDVAAIAHGGDAGDREICFHPVRVLMPDSSGIPLLADLTAMRAAMVRSGKDGNGVNPLIPVDIVVDHSATAEFARSSTALSRNLELEYRLNDERYKFLKWAATAYENFRVLPPGSGIVHQVNLEFLARPVWSEEIDGVFWAYPDTLVGMDSHTPMINGIGVLGWGVGGIEAGSAMLGEPITMQLPEVVGCRLSGALREGVTSTDLVLTVTERLRKVGVVGRLVEFTGPGLTALSIPDRATLANMAPEYGATMGFSPIDAETIRYLRESGRTEADVALAEAYAKEQGMWGGEDERRTYTQLIEIDLSEIETSVAGPRRPQDRRRLADVPASFGEFFEGKAVPSAPAPSAGEKRPLVDGDVVIASITSCTNTSNPSLLVAAGLLARKAHAMGLEAKAWVKTSLSPGSRIVADYLAASGLQTDLDAVGFNIVGFGCMTCAGGSGSLAPEIEAEIRENNPVVAAVLSANRNFEGRTHPLARAGYLCSPPLTIAYALAGNVLIDFEKEPLGLTADGRAVYLRDIWPDAHEVAEIVSRHVTPDLFAARKTRLFEGDEYWSRLEAPSEELFEWSPESTYLRCPPFFDPEFVDRARGTPDIAGARALLVLGDSITTDHISPGSAIPEDSEAGRYLKSCGIEPRNFSSYIARRVNHEVMMRGTFANLRLVNEMAPGRTGGFTRMQPNGEEMSVFEASQRYRDARTPLVVVAGKEYGTGSSRDWAAKGTRLLGVNAILAESFERIHRSNLVGMGVLPLQFRPNESRHTWKLDGTETYDIRNLEEGLKPKAELKVTVHRANGERVDIPVICRIDTDRELEWYRNGGVLQHVFRAMRD
ncbi:aconitate hydratase AcnA [Nitratireductor indicus]|uniref:aconitate hydratase AcnA n=1 Tax=Nitratireductor indicus TaxID=721133 RepID=UPI0028755554|nr:aconitate hydratase AcnA [Nitratireductor indicus]MDS1138074.1 aconitate hydratase AcnA [Nitratireductor indicus]